MAEIKKNYPPTERSAGKRGDIWEDTTTGVKYKLCSIIDIKAGPDSVIYYQWYPIQTSSGGGTGEPGKNGKSAFEIAVENGFVGTETEWLASLKGPQGDKGDPGEKGNPFVYSDFTAEQLESLKGPQGDKGDPGEKGEKGDDGSLVVNVAKNSQIKSGLRGNILLADCTRNLLNPTLETTTINGVTCTNNGDGTYTLNGTASSDAYFIIDNISKFEDKIYKIVGLKNPTDSYYIFINAARKLDESVEYSKLHEKHIPTAYLSNDVYKRIDIGIAVTSGTTLTNEIVKPMLTTDLSATYDDFVPYGGYEIQSCGKNLMSVNDATNGATLDTNTQFVLEVKGLDKGNITSNRVYLSKDEITVGHNSFKFEIVKDEPYGLKIKHNGYKQDIIIENINRIVRKGTYTISFDVASNNPSVEDGLLLHNIQLERGDTATDFEPYTGETITVTNDTELPAFGLKSHGEVTNIITPANAKIVYPTIESSNTMLTKMQSLEEKLSAIKTS